MAHSDHIVRNLFVISFIIPLQLVNAQARWELKSSSYFPYGSPNLIQETKVYWMGWNGQTEKDDPTIGQYRRLEVGDEIYIEKKVVPTDTKKKETKETAQKTKKGYRVRKKPAWLVAKEKEEKAKQTSKFKQENGARSEGNWLHFTFRGTFFDDKQYIIRLKEGKKDSGGEVKWMYTKNLMDKLNDGSAQIKLQDCINKVGSEDEPVNPDLPPMDIKYWIGKKTHGLHLRSTSKSEKPMHLADEKVAEWKEVKPLPKVSVDPVSKQLIGIPKPPPPKEETDNAALARREYENELHDRYARLMDKISDSRRRKEYAKGYVDGYRAAKLRMNR